MADATLDALLTRKEVLEGIISRIDVWLLVFGIFVVIGVAGESVFGIRAWWNNRKLHTVLESIESLRAVEAAKFNQHAADANREAGIARKEAETARRDAEGFKLDISKANEQSAQADQKAAEAKLELAKLRTPRSITSVDKVVISLAQFKGTEYTFSAVGAGDEPIQLLKQIDGILQNAGWKRVKPPAGFPAINVFGSEVDFAVAIAIPSGLRISVDATEPLATLQSLPSEKWPPLVTGAVALNLTLTSNLSPPREKQEGPNMNLVDVRPGSSTTIRISVGVKP